MQMFSDDINDKIKDAFKFRNEISILTKENEDLSKEILALKEQIKKMENLIGQNDYKQMSFTK